MAIRLLHTSLLSACTEVDMAAVIFGAPVYLGSMTAPCNAFIDRYMVVRRNGWPGIEGGVALLMLSPNAG